MSVNIIFSKNMKIRASKLKANSVEISTEILNMISSKEILYENEFSIKGGILTATIENKGKIEEVVVPSTIEVNDKLIFNKKDITDQLSSDNLIKTLSSQSNLSIEQINLIKQIANSKEWQDKTTTLSGMGALIVQAVVTYFTAGAGTGLTASISNAALKAATNAAIQSLITQTTVQLATSAITGNSFKLDTDSLVKGAVSAGVMSYASSMIDSSLNLENLKVADMSYSQQLQQGVSNTVVKSAIDSAIYGTDFKDNLLFNAGNTVQGKVSNIIGYNYINGELNYTTHKLAHLASGAIGATIRGEDLESGALGAVTGEVIGEAVGTNLIKDGDFTQSDEKIVKLSSSLGTIFTAEALGKDAKSALNSSIISVENNVILHAPGTFSSKKDVDKGFEEKIKEFYNDDKFIPMDNDRDLENNDGDRQLLADKIVDKILEIKKDNPNEPIYLTGHSHGGNVQKIVTQKLVEQGHSGIVDSIMYLGTPVRDDYVTNNLALTQNATVFNVYDKDDMVQKSGNNQFSIPYVPLLEEFGPSGQIIKNNLRVQNIQVESPKTYPNESFYYKYKGDHINIDSSEVINQVSKKINQ